MNYWNHFLKIVKFFVAGVFISLALPATAQPIENIKVVATFSILGDMVTKIGGEHVFVTTLVGPNGDTHVYRPTPAAARTLREADVLIVNGLGFEGWLSRLVEASGFDGNQVVATTGIKAIPYEKEETHDEHSNEKHHDKHAGDDHGAFDPHAWQSLAHAVIYVNNITAALAQINPDNAATFYQNRAAYIAEINELDKQIHEMVASLPQNRRTVVTSHDAFQYFGGNYGLTFLAPQGLSTESEASAQDMAHLIQQIREKQISSVFVENITNPRLLQQIAKETGASIGGTLYPGALSEPDGPASTYLEMIRHNATMLAKALGS
jgi:zinc/manganese transport system substrate-binding protein